MIGSTLAGYRVLEQLGAGGMGVVYRARDDQLDRDLAIKVLSPGMSAQASAKERFLREARVMSRLDHPNVCTVHQVGETDEGHPYMVMAYYEGEELSRRIQRGPVDLDEALRIIAQVVAGLDYAHGRGVVHRDVKPANVILTLRGEAKLLDFGLAKLGGAAVLTRPGDVFGTVAYMSPEQASGQPVDVRSDIWSTGVVLYEMLARRLPYGAKAGPQMLYAILQDDPQPLPESLLVGNDGLQRILDRALAREPSARYARMADLLRDIERLADVTASGRIETPTVMISAPTPGPRSLLVLPFTNFSADEEDDYFSDGLTEEVIADLSRVRSLRTLSSNSSRRLKGRDDDPAEIARELGVEFVLQGTVRRSGSHVRITAKLIDPSATVVWAEKYRGTLEDIFAIQEEISRQIVDALEVQLSDEEEADLAVRPIDDFEAYECYLRAKHEFLRYTKESLERAEQYLRKGMDRAGENVHLISALGLIYWQYVNAGISSDTGYVDRARGCAERIRELDPSSPHGYRLLGLVHMYESQPQQAVRLLNQALEQDPNDADTLGWLVSCYSLVGKPTAAVPLAKRLGEVDPLTPVYQALSGVLAMMAGAFDRALEPLERSFKMDPTHPGVGLVLAQALALSGDRTAALTRFDAVAEEAGDSFFGRLARLYRHALLDDREGALAVVTEEFEQAASADLQYSWSLAECYALIGEKERALDWLESAVGRGFLNYPLLSQLDPLLASIRSGDRYTTLMLDVKRRWLEFEV